MLWYYVKGKTRLKHKLTSETNKSTHALFTGSRACAGIRTVNGLIENQSRCVYKSASVLLSFYLCFLFCSIYIHIYIYRFSAQTLNNINTQCVYDQKENDEHMSVARQVHMHSNFPLIPLVIDRQTKKQITHSLVSVY